MIIQRIYSPYNELISVPGILTHNDFNCCTLEPGFNRPPLIGGDGKQHVCIPAGTYTLGFAKGEVYTWMCNTLKKNAISAVDQTIYQLFLKYGVPLINVPGRSGTEMHIGNWGKNSLACTLIGNSVYDTGYANELLQSTITYFKFYPVINNHILKGDKLITFINPV